MTPELGRAAAGHARRLSTRGSSAWFPPATSITALAGGAIWAEGPVYLPDG